MTDDQILDTILRHEGGYVDHPNDTGRCTNWGITLRTLCDWRGKTLTCEDVRALSVDEAKAIYTARYLKPFADVSPGTLKAQVVDIAVNSGPSVAKSLLSLARSQRERPVETQLVIERLKHYARITKARPQNLAFLPGWVNRACSFL